ncbi:unnamed protein product, partial [Ectocarpus sp. 12 AP-2014]
EFLVIQRGCVRDGFFETRSGETVFFFAVVFHNGFVTLYKQISRVQAQIDQFFDVLSNECVVLHGKQPANRRVLESRKRRRRGVDKQHPLLGNQSLRRWLLDRLRAGG